MDVRRVLPGFSGDRRANNAWRAYQLVTGHPVDAPPIPGVTLERKPPHVSLRPVIRSRFPYMIPFRFDFDISMLSRIFSVSRM